MWLEQKVYTLTIERVPVSQEDILENIKVKLNNNLTTIKLIDLFVKISGFEFSEDGQTLKIIGWSILQVVEKGQLILDKNSDNQKLVDINFESEDFGKLKIREIKNNWFMLNDISIVDEDVASFYKKVEELTTVKTEEEEEAGGGSPHTKPPVFVNATYNKALESFKARGFKEFVSDNFKLLISDKKQILVEILNEKELEQYNDPGNLFDKIYRFSDDSNNQYIDADINTGELVISFEPFKSEVEESEEKDIEIEKPDEGEELSL